MNYIIKLHMYKYLHISLLCLIFAISLFTKNIYAQDLKNNVIYDKYSNIKKNIKSNKLEVKGKIAANATYRETPKENTFDYRINTTLQFKFKGLTLPFTYNLSNGRSVSRFNLPSYRTPSFNNLGVSPTHKWAKLHLGHRQMSFSKYTYDNLRFKGFGMELKPDKWQLLAFKGQLYNVTNRDLYYNQNIESPYVRNAWGTMFGYSSESSELLGIVFSSIDDRLRLVDQTLDLKKVSNPKDNTVVSFKFRQKFNKEFEIKIEKALSALTLNSNEPRINVNTQHTVYNLLGLYSKKPSSQYREATSASLAYTKDKYSLSYIFEEIAKEYRSLGSLLFDNGFSSHTVSTALIPSKKLSLSNDLGVRKESLSNVQSHRLIFNSITSYTINENLQTNFSISNFRNTQLQYFQNLNSLVVDSLQLSLVNFNIQSTTNYFLDKDKKEMINFMASSQNSNSIEKDTLNRSSNNKSKLFGINYSNALIENHSFQVNVNAVINSSNAYKVFMLNSSATHNYNVDKNSTITNTLQHSFQKVLGKNRNTLMLSNGYDLNLQKNASLRATSRTLFFSEKRFDFKFQEWVLDLSVNYSF